MGTWWVSFENLCKERVLFLTAADQGTRGQDGCECLCSALLSRFSSPSLIPFYLLPPSLPQYSPPLLSLPSFLSPPSLPPSSISYSHSFSFPHSSVGHFPLSSCPLVPFPILPLHTQEELISVTRLVPQISTPPQRLTPPFTHPSTQWAEL